jgi:hypothetical protein
MSGERDQDVVVVLGEAGDIVLHDGGEMAVVVVPAGVLLLVVVSASVYSTSSSSSSWSWEESRRC